MTGEHPSIGIYRREDSVDLVPRWAKLAENAAIPNPFFVPSMLLAALAHHDPDRDVALLTVEAAGELIGLMPVRWDRGFGKIPIRFVEVWQPPDFYNGSPLLAPNREREAMAAILLWLDTHPDGARFLRLNRAAAAVGNFVGRQADLRKARQRALLNSGPDWDTHLKTVYDGKKRKQMRRLAKRLGELGATTFRRQTITKDVIDCYLALESGGWKGRDPGGEALAAVPARAAFFRAAMLAAADEGQAHCLQLDLDDVPIAMLFVLESAGQRVLYKTSFDETFSNYSPGVQLLMEATRRMLDESNAMTYDSCAKEDHPVMNSLWPERATFADIHVAASGSFDRALLSLGGRLGDLRAANQARPGPRKKGEKQPRDRH